MNIHSLFIHESKVYVPAKIKQLLTQSVSRVTFTSETLQIFYTMKCQIQTTEMHTGGEPVRIIESGLPPVRGDTILAKRQYASDVLDNWRRLLMWEPRGHRDMYGALLVEPDHDEASVATLFLHNAGYSTMCGHAVIALARYAVDKGLVPPSPPSTPVNIQCPCGLVRAWVDTNTSAVRFHSVACVRLCCW
jgi:proline racemase